MFKNASFGLNRELEVEVFGSVILLIKLFKMVFTISSNGNSVDVTNANSNTNEVRSTTVWKRIVLSILASLPYFTHGVETTALTSSVHSGHFVSTSGDVPWSTTAQILATIVSAPVYCFLVDRYGRKSGIYLISLAQGASCIPLFLAETELRVIFLHVLAGISSGGLFTVLPTYIREISDDRVRGFTLSLMMVMTSMGYLMYLVVDLEIIMFLMVALVAAQFLTMLLMMESPSYLVMRGKDDMAKKSISKLICTNEEDPEVTLEFDSLKAESERARVNGDLTLWTILKNPVYRDIIKIGLVLNSMMVLCGSVIFLDQEKTLMQLRMVWDTERILVLTCMVCGSLFTLLMIKFLDRKTILTIALTCMVLSLGVLAVFTQIDLTIFTLRTLPIICLGILVFAYGAAWGMPVVILVEIMNFEICSRLLCGLYVYTLALKLLHVHTFKYIEQHMGIYTVLYIFAGVNMFGAVYALFLLPNIKDKSIKQIERQLKRVPLLKFNSKPIKV